MFNYAGNSLSKLEDFLINLRKNIRDRFDNHVKKRDGTARDINGAHDVNEFYKAVAEMNAQKIDGITIENIRIGIPSDIGVPGVKNIPYKVRALLGKPPKPGIDEFGNPVFTARTYEKTVYDPGVWPDERIIKAAEEAAIDAISRDGRLNREWSGFTKEGYKIHGYATNGQITSYHFDKNQK